MIAVTGSLGVRELRSVVVLGLTLGLGACASSSSPRTDTAVLGYGTPGVSSYVQGDEATSLQAQLDRCRDVSDPAAANQTQGLAAACGQLRRTLRNQPGNVVGEP